MSTLLQQKCPNCGGSVSFDSGSQKLKCPYCDSEFDVEAIAGQRTEDGGAGAVDNISWESDTSEWTTDETTGMRVYMCNSCSGEVVADETTGATSCPYCGSPVVMKGQFDGALRPHLVIPFKLDKEAAKKAFKKHISGKKFVARAFKDDNKIDEIKGVYVPHWLFSCQAEGQVSFMAEKTTRRWSDSNNNYTEITEYDCYRSGNMIFDNVPVDGSTKMPDDLMESLEPFNISDAVPFNVGYLSGYLADKFDVDATSSMPRANERIRQSLAETLKKTVEGYDSVTTIQSNMTVLGGDYKYALYPVWLLTIKHKDKDHVFAMNGQTGKFVGNIPTDTKKVKTLGALIGAGIGVALWAALNLIGLI